MRGKEREMKTSHTPYLILTSHKNMFRADCPHYLLSVAALHYKQIVMTEPQRVLENPNFHGRLKAQFGLANGQAALTCQAPSFLPPYFADQFSFFFAPFPFPANHVTVGSKQQFQYTPSPAMASLSFSSAPSFRAEPPCILNSPASLSCRAIKAKNKRPGPAVSPKGENKKW